MVLRKYRRKSGFTLLELLVVVAILAILAGLVIPQLGSTTERSQAATAAANLADVTRKIEEYRAMNGAYSDNWDTLLESETGAAIAAPAVYQRLNPSLVALLDTQLFQPSAAQLDVMKVAGVWHGTQHAVDTSYLGRPNDSGILGGHLTAAHGSGLGNMPVLRLAVEDGSGAVDPTAAAYNILASANGVPGFNLHVSRFIALHDFIALGLGPKNGMVGETMVSPPSIDVHDQGQYYSRPIAIFAVPKDAALAADPSRKVRFIGVLGPDGLTADMYLSSFHRQMPRDH